jgi:hypothetical protein
MSKTELQPTMEHNQIFGKLLTVNNLILKYPNIDHGKYINIRNLDMRCKVVLKLSIIYIPLSNSSTR